MPKYLVIVESPSKTKKLESILGSDYIVHASYGHTMDLDPKILSIDVEDNFKPNYIVLPDKKKVVANLIFHKNKCEEVIIASDLDREGEMIGYGIMKVLHLTNPKRIVFNEITKKAILDAVKKPTNLDMNKVEAQQARRLLDRLMGYKISPILQKYLQGKLSAGRVQSVVVRIIVDMETHITNNTNSVPFFKSTSIFNYMDTNISTVLIKNKDVYKIESKEVAETILNRMHSNMICRVKKATITETKKSPPPPHITSTLMQEASTKCGMNSKRTMEVAQKLYEGGYITYMRTDSTLLSQEAVNMIQKNIIDNYGKEYYMYREHKTNSKDAQEAHEAIRPTDINNTISEGDNITADMVRLYNIIWNRAVASLMANAVIDVQTIDISIDIQDDLVYRAVFEKIKFEGYLVLYNDHDSESTCHIDINEGTIVNHVSTDMAETFTAPPLRYNEAGLIKYLKKEGIGRPSTYASIISKIIEREYVQIKNIDGVSEEIITMNVSSKKYGVIKEKTKSISVGAEKQKIVPTELGLQVNDFMMKHFEPVMGIHFTAGMEDAMDKISTGKAKWYNVLNEYYKLFNPIVESLNKDVINIKTIKNDDMCLGADNNNNMIYISKNKYGWCVKTMEGDKWKYASIGEMKHTDVTVENAIELLQYPKELGKIGAMNVSLCKGKFGIYYKVGAKIIGIQDTDHDLNLEYAKELYLASEQKEMNTFLIGKTKVFIKTGDNGPYIMIPHGTKKPTFISIPKNIDHTKMTATKIKELIDKNKKKKTDNTTQ